MSAVVKLLDQNTSNQIAAGEVVEKPMSVVKELVENALDAGSDHIDVTIYQGGTEYIRVKDNGSGMDAANARMAVLRHATSKIARAEDLLTLKTLGFRGEALPSIASVSHFNLLTREEGSDFATSITIDGGENMTVDSMGGDIGTTVTVKDLFFNVPARRKFLRTVHTEGRYISDILSKIALSRPDVHITLTNNDKEVINTPGSGDILDTIESLYGRQVTEALLPVSFEQEGIRVEGYVSNPTLLKGTRQWQTLFVNGRYINNRMVSKAIDHAYQSQIPKAGFPFAVLNLIVDTHSIDINVHPQKSEIKFGNEQAVYRAVYRALSDALTHPLAGKGKEGGSITYEKPEVHAAKPVLSETSIFENSRPQSCLPHNPAFHEPVWRTPEVPERPETPRTEEIFKVQRTTENLDPESASTQWEKEGQEGTPVLPTDTGIDVIWPLGQVDKTFIIAQSETALYLIDQHAAHERIMYDRFVRQQKPVPSQPMLIPLFLNVTAQDVEAVEQHREEFMKLGVDAEPAGETVLRVSALPADVEEGQAEGFIQDILKLLSENKAIKTSDLREEVLHYAACHSAIRAGELLNIRQMRQVILELLNTEHPFTCPHGRPCMIEITAPELFKMFKRT